MRVVCNWARCTSALALSFLLLCFVFDEELLGPFSLRNSRSFDCKLSSAESDGFFCEPDQSWQTRRQVYIEQQRKQATNNHTKSQIFWQTNWEPDFSCEHEVRAGMPGDGGKWLCNPKRIEQYYKDEHPDETCIVYSLGSANFYEFEEGIHELLPFCKIFTFDHTVNNPNPPDYVQFFKWGVGAKDEPPLYTIETIMRNLNHSRVELFKIDVEGPEYVTVLPLVKAGRFNNVRQMQIELHYCLVAGAECRGLVHEGPEHHDFFQAMRAAGWVIYHKEPNIQDALGGCVEYGLLHLNWNVTELLAESHKHWCVGGWQGNRPVCRQWGELL